MKRELQQRINALGPTADRLIERLVSRLEMGHQQYGELTVDGGGRRWREELRQELWDAIVYYELDEMQQEMEHEQEAEND
jgi:hypothetical protein